MGHNDSLYCTTHFVQSIVYSLYSLTSDERLKVLSQPRRALNSTATWSMFPVQATHVFPVFWKHVFLTFQHVFPDYRNRCCFWCPRSRDLRFIKLLIIIYHYSRAPFLFLRSALLLHIVSDFSVEVSIPEAAHQLHSFCCLSVDSRHAMGRDGLHQCII